MKHQTMRAAVAALILFGLLVAGTAAASDGRIQFSGAILAPTCATAVALPATSDGISANAGDAQSNCAAVDGAAAATRYDLSTTTLPTMAGDGARKLLRFFAREAADAIKVDTGLVTRTYE
ncbi:MAG TPA: hypothetical protein VFG73_03135 [Rhodanobacteraceae bacterium]|nr:hypothetical protein [Rhodanobacteraceae bacterium]